MSTSEATRLPDASRTLVSHYLDTSTKSPDSVDDQTRHQLENVVRWLLEQDVEMHFRRPALE
jgi:hypothetical protein